jgi:FAD/FMN-containing dehydrogenase
VGREHVLSAPDELLGFNTDWTGRFVGNAAAVVRPASTEEVAGVIAACVRNGWPVTAQGGNTGLVGGGITRAGGVVLSTRRIDDVRVDSAAGQVIAGAGATLGSVHERAQQTGLSYAVDLASRDSATIGGTIATNAGGLRVLRRGDTRAQVVGIEAVLGDGSVISHLGGLARDNTGYHLPSLLCGSEGTLAVVTRARLRLSNQLAARAVALFALESAKSAADAALHLRREPAVEAVELMLRLGLALVCEATGLPAPFPGQHAAYLLVEVSAGEDPLLALEPIVEGLAAIDVAVAADPAGQRRLWAYRERHTEAINTLGPPHKLDVTLPLDAFAHFVDTVPGVVEGTRPQARVWLFGHAAEGSVHVNISGLDPDDEAADDAVMTYVAALGGSISAEHGIGRAKVRWLSLNRSEAEIAAFGRLKQALDPAGILNPGVLLGQRI